MYKVLWFILGLSFSIETLALEKILNYHSDIHIQLDGSMMVTETIKVVAENIKISRGIYRDFPLKYRGSNNDTYKVDFTLLDVKRDGRSESFHTKRINDDIRIYIGQKNYILPPGEYTYSLKYKTNRQLRFLAEHDELYWNVTGNGWNFRIEKASATVHLPFNIGAEVLQMEFYTGILGSREKQATANILSKNKVAFTTTEFLPPHAGLSIVVGWPKNLIAAPDNKQKFNWWLRDNPQVIAAFVSVLILFLFYYITWHRIGRDKLSPVTIPIYEPPENYSPSACRFIWNMGYDPKTFATCLVSIAVKGCLAISKGDKHYILAMLKMADEAKPLLTRDEYLVYSTLFKDDEYLVINADNQAIFSSTISKHSKALEEDYDKKVFRKNRGWAIFGFILSIIAVLTTTIVGTFYGQFEASTLPVTIVSVVVFFMMYFIIGRYLYRWLLNKLRRYGRFVANIAPPLVLVVLFFGFISFYSIFIVSILALNVVFFELLKAPTLAGRRVYEELTGLHHYIDIAEKDELQLRHPPGRTPQTYERLLPFSLALDMENIWGQGFSKTFEKVKAQAASYHPSWYDGSDWNDGDFTHFNSSLSDNISTAISSVSSNPTSSSNFSSSGFSSSSSSSGGSGGGGGGGGGGGW